MSHRLKLVIFDIDGTLTDAYEAIADSFNFTMRCLGLPLRSKTAIRRAVGRGDIYLLKQFVPSKNLPQAIRIYRKRHAVSLRRYARFMPGARELIMTLKKRGCLIAVASNRPTRFTRILLESLKVFSQFDKILCADKLAYRKPHPMIINRLVRELGVEKKDVYYVGDMALDVVTGKRAHVATIALPTGSNTLGELKRARPTFLLKDLKALQRLVIKGKL